MELSKGNIWGKFPPSTLHPLQHVCAVGCPQRPPPRHWILLQGLREEMIMSGRRGGPGRNENCFMGPRLDPNQRGIFKNTSNASSRSWMTTGRNWCPTYGTRILSGLRCHGSWDSMGWMHRRPEHFLRWSYRKLSSLDRKHRWWPPASAGRWVNSTKGWPVGWTEKNLRVGLS